MIYTAQLPEGYALKDGVALPQIYVMVGKQARAATSISSWGDLRRALAEGGTVRLTQSITASPSGETILTVPMGKTVTLDLAGFTIDRNLTTAIDNGHVIQVDGTLTLKDTSESKEGKITGGNNTAAGGGVYVSGTGIFTMEDGGIVGNKTTLFGGVYVYNEGTFNIGGSAKVEGNTIPGTITPCNIVK